MKPEDFINKLKNSVLDEAMEFYIETFNTKDIPDNIIQYWKDALHLFKKLEKKEQKILFSIIQQTIIDTTNTILGIIDGSTSLDKEQGNFCLKYTDKNDKEVVIGSNLLADFCTLLDQENKN
ncbi:hypothetical protein MWMV8_MWMV8_03079 [Acinetobacter calcoaceticus]|nr:hypothetical protein MWMV8_MWMV8_03079 [Acinetobacter calcoaceticus]